jgi:3-oxoacyl-[acyl-carrier protein] reductase
MPAQPDLTGHVALVSGDEVREFVSHSDDHIHVARPEDVAEAILLLCAPGASMITGNIVQLR